MHTMTFSMAAWLSILLAVGCSGTGTSKRTSGSESAVVCAIGAVPPKAEKRPQPAGASQGAQPPA